MLADVFADKGTDNIDLVVFFACPVQRAFSKDGSQSQAAQFLGDFSVDEFKNISVEAVLNKRQLAVPFDFDAPADYILERRGFGMNQLTRAT